MPGFARRVRTAYSRTLCLPCLKAGIFCFLHYRYWPLYVQLFIFNFLCICLLPFVFSFFSFSYFPNFPLGAFFTDLLKPPHGSHAGSTGPVWGFAGGFPLPRSQNRTQCFTGLSFIFCVPKQGYPSTFRGGWVGFYSNWGVWVFPAPSAFGNCCPQLPHTAPTGPVTGFAGVVLLPCPQNRTQALTGPSLGFTVFSGDALGLAALPSPAPACNLPPPGWDE